ncbi:MAG: glycosyltransferase family 4 protein [bacterium]
MKLFYIANARIPTEKAHGIQIMKTCEALSKQGIEVELIVPNRDNNINEDPFYYYKIERNFNIKKIYSPDLVRFGKAGVLFQYLFFSWVSLFYCLKGKVDFFYSRDELPIWFLSLFGKKVFWESHNGKWNFLVSSIVKRASGTVTISQGIKNFFINKGIKEDKIFVSPDAVDLKDHVGTTKDEARKKVGLPSDKKIILYTGHLYGWKGVNTLAESAKSFDEMNLFVFVGGTEGDVNSFKQKYSDTKNILVLGQKPHSDIPLYLSSADVLVLPNSGKEDISRLYTSPMKLFEYMASGRPIIASNLPSIREILNEDNAVFFESDNPGDLSRSIKKVLGDKELGDRISKQSLLDVKKYTWENRAKNIINFINAKR